MPDLLTWIYPTLNSVQKSEIYIKQKTSDSRHNLDLFAVIQVPVLEGSSFQWLVIFKSPKTSILQVVMSVVRFLPLLLTEVGNNNFWATMKQNKTKQK